MSEVLVLNVKKIYFDQVKSGEKTEEFRLCTDYWKKRLEGRSPEKVYSTISYRLGYPKSTDNEKILTFPYTGWEKKKILHPHFGKKPAWVYAIPLTNNPRF